MSWVARRSAGLCPPLSARASAPPMVPLRLPGPPCWQGPSFEFQERAPGAAPYLRGIFAFNYSALASMGLSASALSGAAPAPASCPHAGLSRCCCCAGHAPLSSASSRLPNALPVSCTRHQVRAAQVCGGHHAPAVPRGLARHPAGAWRSAAATLVLTAVTAATASLLLAGAPVPSW